MEILHRGGQVNGALTAQGPLLDSEDVEDLDEAPDSEVEVAEDEILDQATAARTIEELRIEIETLQRLEGLALAIRRSGEDKKWRELATLLGATFTTASIANAFAEDEAVYDADGHQLPGPKPSPQQKLVLFTEHRDTLNYLQGRIATLLGRQQAVVAIHGGMGREERMNVQEAFRQDSEVQVLLATDAAGEGINLQRAHLMVNYDLPWNPNRLEQRFGRIHRIGQTEVCHLWNLVAEETREGDVYRKLLEKLEQARKALGGQVFDVLGKLQFEGRPLRELLIDAIRYGEQPEVRARLTRVVENAFDRSHLQDLLEERGLAHDTMDVTRVHRICEEMERAAARRLQPHYIESFFMEAFRQLGGTVKQREARRYEITHVPAPVRNRDRLIGFGYPAQPRYERIAFEKDLVTPVGQTPAAFLCPGHPLLNAVIDLTLERQRDLLRRGSVLVDERDAGTAPRVLFFLEHAIQDASITKGRERRVISKRLLFVEVGGDGVARHLNYAPYLDYRPLKAEEPSLADILARSECGWISRELEGKAQAHAIANVVPEHLAEVRERKIALLDKTEAAVKDRLTKEINYWDFRAEQLKDQERAGKPNARLNSGEARKRADEMQARPQKRMEEIKQERQLSPLPPVVLGGVLVVPAGILGAMAGRPLAELRAVIDTQASAARARDIIMEVERGLGYVPVDRELEKLGYDIESAVRGPAGCGSSKSKAGCRERTRSRLRKTRSFIPLTSRMISFSQSSSSSMAASTRPTTCGARFTEKASRPSFQVRRSIFRSLN
jgi:Helicase conserved C-terminal domain